MIDSKKLISDVFGDEVFDTFGMASKDIFIYACDLKSGLSRWSKRSVDYFGLPGEYMEDASSIWLEHIHPEDVHYFVDDIKKVFAGESLVHACEYRAKNRNGEYVWLECRGRVSFDKKGDRIFAGIMTRLDYENKYDSLTHLKTMSSFDTASLREKMSIILLGFDNFRNVINSYGYDYGDVIISSFAKKVYELCRYHTHYHYVYRFSGDEFLIVTELLDKDKIKDFYEEVKSCGLGIGNEACKIDLSLSAGCIQFPIDGKTKEEIFTNLEHSLENAKKLNRGGITFFNSEMVNAQKRDNLIGNDIIESINKGFEGFELYYQPLIDSNSLLVKGSEALLRYFSKKFGYVSPLEVIKHAKKRNCLDKLGRWIIDTSFKQAGIWQKQYSDHKFVIGINISYEQYHDPSFVDFIIETAKKHNVDPHLISLELTESTKVDDDKMLSRAFNRLQEEGFMISLDDFGVEYSNLDLLRKLDVDSVKIDQSFIFNLNNKTRKELLIVNNVIDLCHKLNLKVVAEGVETREMFDLLFKYKVNYIQGYYFSKPLDKESFESIIEKKFD